MAPLNRRSSQQPVFSAATQTEDLQDLLGHEGPVWQVAWGHPKFGALLASASFDHRVIVWKEGPDGAWSQVRNQKSAYLMAANP